MEKKKKILLLIILSILLIGMILFIISAIWPTQPQKKDIRIEIPDAKIQNLPAEKIKAYREDQHEGNKIKSYDDYIKQITGQDLSEQSPEQSIASKNNNNVLADQQKATERLHTTIRSASKTQPTSSNPPVQTIQYKKDDDWKERYDYMYSKIYGQPSPEPNTTKDTIPKQLTLPPTQPTTDDFITIIGGAQTVTSTTAIKAVTVENQRIVNGSKVAIRILDELHLNNFILPRNTYIYSIARINHGRLELTVSSIEYNGILQSCHLAAYDTDGYLGIYCPSSSSAKNTNNEVANNVSQLGSAVAGTVTRGAAQLINSATRLMTSSNRDREQEVSLPSNYQFYLSIVKK